MASVVSICNLALSHLGDRATLSSIDPPEGSAQADHCAQFWPIARDEALAAFDWRFASHVATPAQLDDSVRTHPSWTYAYALPADFLMAREFLHGDDVVVLEPGSPLFDTGTLNDGTPVFFAHSEGLALRYTRRVSDPSRYPVRFVPAVSYLLASYLAGPVIKGKAGAQMASINRQAWERLASAAATVDANQSHGHNRFSPAGLRARGYGAGTTIVERGDYRHELPYWAQG